jgi:hypothetical protein
MKNKIVQAILEAKLQDLPFYVLKNGIDWQVTEKDFLNYSNYYHKEILETFDKSCRRNTREDISNDDLRYFPDWSMTVKELSKLYGNTDTYYLSLMQTGDVHNKSVHAVLHNDQSDVVHINCFGKVEWLLIDPYDESKTEHRVILESGDVLYMRGWTLHETTPLTPRGSLIFMNLPYVPIPKDLNKETQREKVISDLDKDILEKRRDV